MSYAVKYRGEFSDVFGGEKARGNLITGWTNFVGGPYDTLTTSDAEIVSAINTLGIGVCRSSTFNLADEEIVVVSFNLTLNSGDPPLVAVENLFYGASGSVTAVEGVNVIVFTATETMNNSFVQMYNDDPCDYSTSEVVVEYLQPHDWKIEILEDGFAGTVTDMKMTGEPMSIEWPSTSDDIFEQNIRGSQASINVWAETDFAYSELFTSDNFEYKVNIYNDDDLFWTGWIVSESWREPYAVTPYPVTITATDGLGLLKENEFSDLSLTGRQTLAKCIFDILGTINITEFIEYINIYHANTDNDTDDSSLDVVYIDTELLAGETNYDSLEIVLKTFNACIVQEWGQIKVYRYKEMASATVYGRKYTSATVHTAESLVPLQYINRTAQSSNFLDSGGGELSIIPQIKDLNIHQLYGNKESWIPNYQPLVDTYDSYSFPSWTTFGSAQGQLPPPPGRDVDGFEVLQLNTYPTLSKGVSNTFGTYGLTTTDRLIIEFDYATYNYDSSTYTNKTFYWALKSGSKYLYDFSSELYKWQTGIDYMPLLAQTIPLGMSDWTTFSRQIDGLPNDGPYTIYFYAGGDAQSVSPVIRNVRFYSVSGNITEHKIVSKSIFKIFNNKTLFKLRKYVQTALIVNKVYNITNSNNGSTIDLAYELGDVADANIDNVVEQFQGALSYDYTENFYKEAVITISGTSGLASIECNSIPGALSFETDLETTAANFVSEYAATYAAAGITVTSTLDEITFTSTVLGLDFDISITPDTGDLDGTILINQVASITTHMHTSSWSTRGGSENDPIIELIGGEIGNQFSRPKHLLDIQIYERNSSFLKLVGRFEDVLNQYSGNNRKFVFSRAVYDVKNRLWDLTLNELI